TTTPTAGTVADVTVADDTASRGRATPDVQAVEPSEPGSGVADDHPSSSLLEPSSDGVLVGSAHPEPGNVVGPLAVFDESENQGSDDEQHDYNYSNSDDDGEEPNRSNPDRYSDDDSEDEVEYDRQYHSRSSFYYYDDDDYGCRFDPNEDPNAPWTTPEEKEDWEHYLEKVMFD
ncbi:hypothetical protein HK405_005760, partial [Cladochytrium tenue]